MTTAWSSKPGAGYPPTLRPSTLPKNGDKTKFPASQIILRSKWENVHKSIVWILRLYAIKYVHTYVLFNPNSIQRWKCRLYRSTETFPSVGLLLLKCQAWNWSPNSPGTHPFLTTDVTRYQNGPVPLPLTVAHLKPHKSRATKASTQKHTFLRKTGWCSGWATCRFAGWRRGQRGVEPVLSASSGHSRPGLHRARCLKDSDEPSRLTIPSTIGCGSGAPNGIC